MITKTAMKFKIHAELKCIIRNLWDRKDRDTEKACDKVQMELNYPNALAVLGEHILLGS